MAAVAAANSRKFSAARASPLAKRAMAGSTSGSTSRSKPRPRVRSSIARCRMTITASACSGCSTNTLERESSAAFTSNEGFSVVAPIRTMSPASTRGRNASCCALLKRWISSTNTMVRRPVRRRRSWAAAITSRISLMPDSTALNGTKDASVRSAMSRASVVLPVPGGPQSNSDCRTSFSIARRSGAPGARIASCPTISSSVRGRMRSASGVPLWAGCSRVPLFATGASGSSSNRLPSLMSDGAARRRPARRRPRPHSTIRPARPSGS